MCKVLLPIKPEYAYQIFMGTKKFEYRKNKFKRENVDSIVVYVTAPVKKIIGEVELVEILEDSPLEIWKETHNKGGIKREEYDTYFKDKKKAFAYVLGKIKKYDKEKLLEDLNISYAPQSYVYLD